MPQPALPGVWKVIWSAGRDAEQWKGPMSAEENLTASVRLPRSSRCGRIARHMLERELAAAVSSERLEDGKSIVSELANNAYQHGVGRIDLTITPLADRIRVEITDQGAGLRPTALDPSGHRGLGLRIVDALALAWGARDGRSQVWAEFAR